MKTKKVRLKLKPGVINVFKIIGVILVVVLAIYMYYCKQISNITELGYSEVAAKKILFDDNKDYFMAVKDNETLNAAIESENYNEKYIKNYAKIDYYDQKNLIKNVNALLGKGYSNSEVSMILAHGNDEDVSEFAKRERVRYLEEFYEYPYAKIKYYDRYLVYTDETGEDEKTTVIHVNLNMDKTEYDDAVSVDKFSFDMLVNKYHKLDENFEVSELISIPKDYTGEEEFSANKTAVNALIQMFESAKVDGLEMVVNSAYRSYADQIDIQEYYRKWYGDKYVTNYVARPGYSEHQTGLAFDIGSTSSNVFANSKEYEWMQENAYKYGFILRFTKSNEHITGYRNEPWHYRYVGKDIAKYIYENDITLEEYYVMFLDK